MQTIHFVTGNENKFKEVQLILKDIPLVQIDIDLEEIQSADIVKVATAKVKAAYEHCNQPVVVEDTGFYIDALGGFPGTFIKYAEKAMGKEAVLRLLGDDSNRVGYAKTIAAYYDGQNLILGEGVLKGHMSHELRGDEGFFFDYCFVPDGYDKTCAEMGLEEKVKISHRTRAFKDLLDKLQ